MIRKLIFGKASSGNFDLQKQSSNQPPNRYKISIAYDGTHYAGWQVQPNGTAIQTLIQRALETVLRHPISLTGSSRTDAGVHALGQVAHFDTDHATDLGKLRYAINALLPPDIRIQLIVPAAADFHARYSAMGKIYHYHLQLDLPDPMSRLYRTQVFGLFDLEAVTLASKHLIGTHDFAAFANASKIKDTIRTLKRLDVIQEKGGVRLEFEGDGFLYKMVRNIVGTLLDVAAHRTPPDAVADLLKAKDRKLAGPTANAEGLFLIKVLYPADARKPSPLGLG